MSHEIRTPLTSIIGYAETFFTGQHASNLSAQQLEAIETIVQSGEHLAGLINGILDLSKIEQGKLTCNFSNCSPAALVDEVVHSLQVQADRKNIDLSFTVAPDVPETVATDPARLKQILINLTGNALKFTESGFVQVTVSVDALDAEDSKGALSQPPSGKQNLKFSVRDSGIGIAEEEIDQVFDAFTQADGSLTRGFGGTGLGLTVSKALAKMLGGELFCESELNVGSVFTCSLPIEMKQVSTASSTATDPAGAKDNESSQLNCRVLLAEDAQINRHFISVTLKRAGATVVEAENGEQACELIHRASLTSEPIDIVLMDMQMPVMDGYTATRNLRQKGHTLPIVALTSHAMEGDREKCLEAGCDDYTPKPINRQKLIQIVGNLTNPTFA